VSRLESFNPFLVELRSLQIHAVQFVIRIKLGELDESLDGVLIILDRHAPRSLRVKPDRLGSVFLRGSFKHFSCVIAQLVHSLCKRVSTFTHNFFLSRISSLSSTEMTEKALIS